MLACVVGCGEAPLQPREPTPGRMHFKIATFNVFDHEATNPANLDAIGRLGAEVIALQEVTHDAEPLIRARYLDRYPAMAFHPSGSAGLGFLSAWPIEDKGLTDLGDGWHPAWHVWVTTPRGKIEVLVVHLKPVATGGLNTVSAVTTLGSDHVKELKLYVEKSAAHLPVVVLGDFNEGTDGDAVRYLEGRGFQNALPLFRPGQFTWKARRSVGGQFTQTIDHILFDEHFEPLNAYTMSIGASDHLPVIAHLQTSPAWSGAE
jgi:endonuclease/exonuclease/phosphatase family metal-dependent hydrolase